VTNSEAAVLGSNNCWSGRVRDKVPNSCRGGRAAQLHR
jgi:hypothetical protein